jgi:hypothetical protein
VGQKAAPAVAVAGEGNVRSARKKREASVCMHVPLPLVVLTERREARATPPVREVARAPARGNLEPDLARRMCISVQEPLFAALDVCLQRVVTEPEP